MATSRHQGKGKFLRESTLASAVKVGARVVLVAKTCQRCETLKMPLDFPKSSRRPDGLHAWCKTCCAAYVVEKSDARRLAWRESRRRLYTLNKYGLSREEYEKRRAEAAGCAICGGVSENGKDLHLDHDHKTGRLRGFLCENHNRGLGMFGDDPVLLRAAADYLERS